VRFNALQLEVVEPGAVLMWIFGSILTLLWLLFVCYGKHLHMLVLQVGRMADACVLLEVRIRCQQHELSTFVV
jgi:hypothetical protein